MSPFLCVSTGSIASTYSHHHHHHQFISTIYNHIKWMSDGCSSSKQRKSNALKFPWICGFLCGRKNPMSCHSMWWETLKCVCLDLELSPEFNPELNWVEFAIQQIFQCGRCLLACRQILTVIHSGGSRMTVTSASSGVQFISVAR